MRVVNLTSMPKRKPDLQTGNLSNQQRLAIVHYKDKHPDVSYKAIAKWAKTIFNLSRTPSESTISRCFSRKEELENLTERDKSIRRKRVVVSEELDRALAIWVQQKEQQRLIVTCQLIQEKGMEFGAKLRIPQPLLKFSKGWVHGFCRRHGFRQFKIHGESGAAETHGEEYEAALTHVKSRIQAYDPKDIYNFDESALFYNLSPDKTIAQRQVEGSKKDKTRITIAFTCNADGTDQFEPLFIGHSAKPRCFNKKSGTDLGFWYLNNKRAWMTGEFFDLFLRRFNQHVGRKVLLLIDNAPSHKFKAENYPNVEIVPLPPNTTSKLQPLDAGIIASFKKHYRRYQLRHAINLVDIGRNPYQVSQLEGMRWSRRAWMEIDESVFVNCWRHTCLLVAEHDAMETDDSELTPVDQAFVEEYRDAVDYLGIRNAMPLDNFLNPAEEEEEPHHAYLSDTEILESVQNNGLEEEEEEDSENGTGDYDSTLLTPYHDLTDQDKIHELAKAAIILESLDADGTVTAAAAAIEEIRKAQRNLRWKIREERLAKGRENRVQLKISHFMRVDS
jgi:DDE superfamily endonuclease/Tc5 transposase DNA-binding domain